MVDSHLTAEQIAQLEALDGRPDTADIPGAPAGNWAWARRFWVRGAEGKVTR